MGLRAPPAWVPVIAISWLLACAGRQPEVSAGVVDAEPSGRDSVVIVEREPSHRARELGPPTPLSLPSLADYEQPNPILIPGRVFPIGWSKTGLFAYVYEPPDEACGCYFAHLVVMDLDQPVLEERYSSEAFSEGDPQHVDDLAGLWRLRGPAWSAQLDSYGVEVRDPTSLRPFKAPGSGHPLVEIHSTEVGDDSLAGFAHITRYRVELVNADATTVVFDTGDLGDFGPLAVEALGYLEQPDGPRAAILLLETWRGWEGPPNTARLRFVGAQLE